MNLNRLKWATIIIPIAFLVILQTCTIFLLEPQLGSVRGHLLGSALVAAGVVPFASVVFKVLDSMQQEIARQHAQLLEDQRHMAVLEERERLAGEMHDSLAQVLGYVHLKAQATKRVLARQDVAKAEEELEDIASLAHEAYLDVREAILGLRETVSPAGGIVGTLKQYLQKFSRQAGIRAELEVQGDGALQFSPDAEVQLVRVIQEALTNVRKHANADRAWIRIGRQNGTIDISIEDNGQGFDPAILGADGQRFGVRIMRERVETVGGRFEIESSPGNGTKVQICLALAEGEDNGPR
jgi:signal transduction histidine kinase